MGQIPECCSWFRHKPKAFKDLQLVFPAKANTQHSLFLCPMAHFLRFAKLMPNKLLVVFLRF
jgi:hypothetical protein